MDDELKGVRLIDEAKKKKTVALTNLNRDSSRGNIITILRVKKVESQSEGK